MQLQQLDLTLLLWTQAFGTLCSGLVCSLLCLSFVLIFLIILSFPGKISAELGQSVPPGQLCLALECRSKEEDMKQGLKSQPLLTLYTHTHTKWATSFAEHQTLTHLPSLIQTAQRMWSGGLRESQACQSPNRFREALGSVCTADASLN